MGSLAEEPLTLAQDLLFTNDSSAPELGNHGVNGLLLNQIHHKIKFLYRSILFSMIILGLDIGLEQGIERKTSKNTSAP